MPAWITEEDLDVYAGEFERTGFTGGLNRYRNVDRDWEDLPVFAGRPIEVPALFVGGDRDGRRCGAGAIERFPMTLPGSTVRSCSRAAGTGRSRSARRGERGAARLPRHGCDLGSCRYFFFLKKKKKKKNFLKNNRQKSPTMLERLALSRTGDDVFVVTTRPSAPRFGGLLIGQAMRAAQLTVDTGPAGAHAARSFVVAGHGWRAVRYEVERTRDGGELRHPPGRCPPGSRAWSW